jgi:hypothetical protein
VVVTENNKCVDIVPPQDANIQVVSPVVLYGCENLVSYSKRRTHIEDVGEHGA